MIFDLGGTLWHRDPTRDGGWFWERCYDRLLDDRLPEGASLADVGRERFRRAMTASVEEYQRRSREQSESESPAGIVAGGFDYLGLSPGEGEIPAVLESYAPETTGWVVAFPDARETLVELRHAGYRTGLLSNTWWAAEWLDAELRHQKLSGLFDAVLYTSDLAYSKPHPAVFLETASRLGVEPAECVMVGDEPSTDVAGALGVGMKGVWKRNARSDLGGIKPIATIDRLAELPALLRSWQAS